MNFRKYKNKDGLKNVGGVAAIIKNKDGRYLLHLRDDKTKSMPNQWCLVGGSVDTNEDPYDAICREVLEELGQPLLNVRFLKEIKYKEKIIYIYRKCRFQYKLRYNRV